MVLQSFLGGANKNQRAMKDVINWLKPLKNR